MEELPGVACRPIRVSPPRRAVVADRRFVLFDQSGRLLPARVVQLARALEQRACGVESGRHARHL